MASKLTHERLKEALNYDQATGKFTWLVRGAHRRYPGDEAGCPSKDGRMRVGIDGTLYYRYRLAWFWMTGAWPKFGIDHINGDPTDDRWENLRDATQSVNMQNQKRAPSHSSTGLIGAHTTRNGRYRASITTNRKNKHLGTFDTAEQAHDAYLQAKRATHPGNTL